jgi:hypothetical protein
MGGTRYFPLHYALHAGLMRIGMDSLVSGHSIEIVPMTMLVVGISVVLWNLGTTPWFAILLALAVLASGTAQLAVLTIRGDVLPAASSVLVIIP